MGLFESLKWQLNSGDIYNKCITVYSLKFKINLKNK